MTNPARPDGPAADPRHLLVIGAGGDHARCRSGGRRHTRRQHHHRRADPTGYTVQPGPDCREVLVGPAIRRHLAKRIPLRRNMNRLPCHTIWPGTPRSTTASVSSPWTSRSGLRLRSSSGEFTRIPGRLPATLAALPPQQAALKEVDGGHPGCCGRPDAGSERGARRRVRDGRSEARPQPGAAGRECAGGRCREPDRPARSRAGPADPAGWIMRSVARIDYIWPGEHVKFGYPGDRSVHGQVDGSAGPQPCDRDLHLPAGQPVGLADQGVVTRRSAGAYHGGDEGVPGVPGWPRRPGGSLCQISRGLAGV